MWEPATRWTSFVVLDSRQPWKVAPTLFGDARPPKPWTATVTWDFLEMGSAGASPAEFGAFPNSLLHMAGQAWKSLRNAAQEQPLQIPRFRPICPKCVMVAGA
jgi:hypothetical protein